MEISSLQASLGLTGSQSVSTDAVQRVKEEEAEEQPQATQVDMYIPEETEESAGIYYPTADGVVFNAPTAQTTAVQTTTTTSSTSSSSTDDDTLEELEEEEEELEEEIARETDEDKKAELEKELLQVQQEISAYQSESLTSSAE